MSNDIRDCGCIYKIVYYWKRGFGIPKQYASNSIIKLCNKHLKLKGK